MKQKEKIVFVRMLFAGSCHTGSFIIRGKEAENFLLDQDCHHADGDVLGYWEVPENLNDTDAGLAQLDKHDQLVAILGLDALSDSPDTSDLLGIIFEAGVKLGLKQNKS